MQATAPDKAPAAAEPAFKGLDLAAENQRLESLSAEARVAWAADRFADGLILTSSFGAQAAVCLHLVTRRLPDIPVVVVDTGYLFPETYRFIDEMTEKLSLNLRVYQSEQSPAWMEARHGRLWEQGVEGIEAYNQTRKVAPMRRALKELKVKAWFAGLRREQSASRRRLTVLAKDDIHLKIHPIIDWTSKDVYDYLTAHQLPYHPLWHQGYPSIGDVHTTRKIDGDMTEEEARFFGLKRECGLHETASTDFSI